MGVWSMAVMRGAWKCLWHTLSFQVIIQEESGVHSLAEIRLAQVMGHVHRFKQVSRVSICTLRGAERRLAGAR